jgi:hypothetical protein
MHGSVGRGHCVVIVRGGGYDRGALLYQGINAVQ